jgi:addiction module HigA family antidote
MPQPIHPGKALRREIEARDWTQTYLATQLGWATSELNLVLSGGLLITESRAADLANALGTSPDFWLNLERNYRANLLSLVKACH